jgi:tRNA 2-selenouridine synthase
MNDPALLNAQLEHLVQLHGRAKIDAWHEMANSGRMAELVDELLVDHYDPAYLRSIDRNFVKFNEAQVLEMSDIAEADFLKAATFLHSTP